VASAQAAKLDRVLDFTISPWKVPATNLRQAETRSAKPPRELSEALRKALKARAHEGRAFFANARQSATLPSEVLVLLAPSFEGTEKGYQALARATGLVPYDLRTRAKPGSWGLVKGFGDAGQAQELASRLLAEGFPVVLIDRQVASDPERRHVPVRGLELGDAHFTLKLKDRDMKIPYGALTCIVEGEVQPGRTVAAAPGSTSSGALRAVAPDVAEMRAFREAHMTGQIGYLAADLHFATVFWIARLDARVFEFGPDRTGNVGDDLASVTNQLASRAGVRVDRTVRVSSLASFADQATPLRAASWPPVSARGKQEAADNRFDTYSRLVGEAERAARRLG
jgi:hypothetical protein